MHIKGQCHPLEEFFIAIAVVLLVPLAPLIIEWFFSGDVSTASLLVASIMYVASLTFSTDRKLIFVLGFIAVAYLCLIYGFELKDSVATKDSSKTLSLKTFEYSQN